MMKGYSSGMIITSYDGHNTGEDDDDDVKKENSFYWSQNGAAIDTGDCDVTKGHV